MKAMNWSYEDLSNTPVKVIEGIWRIIDLEAEHNRAMSATSSGRKHGNK